MGGGDTSSLLPVGDKGSGPHLSSVDTLALPHYCWMEVRFQAPYSVSMTVFSLGMERVPLLPTWLSLGFDLHWHCRREAVSVLAGRERSPISLLQYHLIAARWESLSGLHWHCRERLVTARWGWEFCFSTWLLRYHVGSALLYPGKSGILGSHLSFCWE